MAYWYFGAGLVLLLVGSEAAVRGGTGLARTLGWSPLLIGLFVISFGTSAPELAVSLKAGLSGAPDIAVGNIVGSNILNLLLILGLAALIRPMPSPPKVVLRDGGSMLAASAGLAFMAAGGVISRSEGALLLVALFVYIAAILVTDWRRSSENSVVCARAEARLSGEGPSAAFSFLLLLGGLLFLALGAQFAVVGCMKLAGFLHLPQSLLGLTIVAFGSSLPELIVTIVAVVRRQTHMAIGHLIGANTFNILGALGLTAAIRPLVVAPVFGSIDILVMVGASALLLPMLATNWRLSRLQGAVLFLAYFGYLAFLATRNGLLSHML
jgi:cation:H+ antiporter